MSIPVSVIIVTKNEGAQIAACLQSLNAFDDIIVVDSHSADNTADIAQQNGAQVMGFEWNGRYPKKRGWCLENIKTRHDWILFIDADEIMSPALAQDIGTALSSNSKHAGYFIEARYLWDGHILKHGLRNKKLCLLHKDKFHFPVIDDLNFEGMGEIEGHYQPALKPGYAHEKIGSLKHMMQHNAYHDYSRWIQRHLGYARWEVMMTLYDTWPKEDQKFRSILKWVMRGTALRNLRPAAMFVYSYIFKLGFLDGAAGRDFAHSRYEYYRMINDEISAAKKDGLSP